MEFSDYAAKETSALITRIVTETSQASLHRVEALRAALDSASAALEAALSVPPNTEDQVSELVALLAKAATADGDARLKRLSSEARKITETLRAEYDEQTKEKEALAASLEQAQADGDAARARFEAVQEEQAREREALIASLEQVQAEVDAARAELVAAQDRHGRESEALAASIEQGQADADSLRASLAATQEQHARETEALIASIEQGQADADALRTEFELAQSEAEALRGQLADAVGAKQALETARQEAVAAVDEEAARRASIEAELQEVRRQLDDAIGEVTRTIAAGDQEAIARARAEEELHALRSEIEATRAEAANAAVAADEQHGAARAAIQAEVEELRSEVELAKAQAANATAKLQAMVAEKAAADAALNAANSHVETAAGKVSANATLLKASTARVKALEREQEEHASALADLEARLRAAESEAAAARDLEERLKLAEAEASAGGPAAALPLMDGLIRGLEALSAASTVEDVLTTLIEQMAAEFPRVALFHVRGNRLEGAHQIGFALNNDIGKVMMPLAMDSVLTRAVSSGKTERVSGDDLLKASGLPFGGSPLWALASPVVVDGESMAVIYADDSGESRPERQPGTDDMTVKFAEALRQHAIAHLIRLTREAKAQAELSAYAGSLLDEMLQVYQADVAAGKTGNDLHKRLHANLEYARSVYATRVEHESPAAAALFETQLAGMIDVHRDSAFGRDMTVVASWADRSGSGRAAEAS